MNSSLPGPWLIQKRSGKNEGEGPEENTALEELAKAGRVDERMLTITEGLSEVGETDKGIIPAARLLSVERGVGLIKMAKGYTKTSTKKNAQIKSRETLLYGVSMTVCIIHHPVL